jgi:Fe-S cluster assembly scaffold protein SufB
VGRRVAHLSLQKVAAHKDASVRHLSVTMGGATVRLRPECDLLGPGADVRPLGVYFADEGQWFDLQPYVRHYAPHGTSDVFFKGALQGKSRTVFRGNIFVGKDAVGTVTDENNRSLILTEQGPGGRHAVPRDRVRRHHRRARLGDRPDRRPAPVLPRGPRHPARRRRCA